MRFDPITGSEIQVGNGQIAIHEHDNVDELADKLIVKVKKTFEGETSHKIVRVSLKSANTSFFTNAGFEEQLYNDIKDYIKEKAEKETYPLVFHFISFVSYSPLRAVDKADEV